MRKTILLQALVFFTIPSFSQNYKVIDSLKRTLLQEKVKDTNTVNRYRNLAAIYGWNEPDSSIHFYNQAIALSKKLDFSKGEFLSLRSIAFVLALVRLDSAAVSSAYRAIKIAEGEKNKEYIAAAYFTLGSVYIHIKDFNKGIYYHRSAMSYSTDSLFLNVCYQHLAQCFIGLNQTDSAFFYAKKVLAYNKLYKIKNQWDVYQMGAVYFQKGLLDSALIYYKEALRILSPAHNAYKKDFAGFNIGIANVFQRKNIPDSVIYYAKNALNVSGSIGLSNEKLEALNLLTSGFESQSNLDSAYFYQKYALALKDSVYNTDKVRQVQLLSFNEDLRKQQEAEEKRKRLNTILLYSLLAAFLFTLIIAAIIFRNNKQRRKAYDLLQKQKQEIDTQRAKAEKAFEELKSTQQQLIQSEKMASLGELTAGIAHEIQNPLNFVNNFSETNIELIEELEEEIQSGNTGEVAIIANTLKENEHKILHHGKRADAIVKGMLQHSRKTTDKKEPTDINALADEYVRLSYHGLRAKDKSFSATIKTEFDERIGSIEVIPQDIGRVLLNLLNNAFYSVHEKKKQLNGTFEPSVSVSTKKENGSVIINVKDNGVGIPEKVLNKIYQPFFTTKPTGEGTGLGLSLSYDIITKGHGGEMKVETKEGEGAEFIIQLPAGVFN